MFVIFFQIACHKTQTDKQQTGHREIVFKQYPVFFAGGSCSLHTYIIWLPRVLFTILSLLQLTTEMETVLGKRGIAFGVNVGPSEGHT